MNSSVNHVSIAIVCVVAILAVHYATTSAAAGNSGDAVPCSRPEFRQFDFWVGDWDAFEVDDSATAVARNHVSRILDGCVLLEDYEGTDGLHGQSFTIYDATRSVWHQSWVTNRGELLTIEGQMRGDELVLSGMDHTVDGKERHVRGIWKPVDGGVRETAATSMDGGKTWKPWFDILFRPHARKRP